MSPQQVGEAFGASASDVSNVVAYLRSQGMKATESPNHMAVLAESTVSQAQTAFGVQIKNLTGPDPSGKAIVFQANTGPVSLPSGIAPVVVNVAGLDNYARPHHHDTLIATTARTLYNTAPSYANSFQGQGRKIAYSNWLDYRLADANVYISTYGLPVPAAGAGSNIHVVPVGTGHDGTTASGEGNLDMQLELAAAPLADIYIYDDGSEGNLLGVLTQEASDNIADVISESYGWSGITDSLAVSVHNQHLAMTAQGQTYVCSSGDSGTADLLNFPYPDEDPEVLTVGGTVASIDALGNRTSELAWIGSGGGWSADTAAFNVLPSWQHGTGVPTGNNHRLVPDIAMQADGAIAQFTVGAFTMAYNGSIQAVSGTSCSSPFFASCLATLEQRLAAAGQPARFGRIADLIYSENGRADVWLDITGGSNNGALLNGSTASPGPGWDFVTGWGAPNFDAWYSALVTRQVSGTVALGNYSGAVAGTTITVQLYQAGTSVVADTLSATLDESGNFSVSSQAPVGTYDVYVKAPHWLRKKTAGVAFDASGASGLSYSLVNGDVNGDNRIALSDFAVFKAAFGTSSGDGNYNVNADLNGDGHVTLSDFAVLKSNFGQSGD